MKRRLAAAVTVIALAGCDRLPGKPDASQRYIRPEHITDFDRLYASHCAGCHGPDGRGGAAQPLNDPLYLAVVPDAALTRIIGEGVDGTLMPGFAQAHGGGLTDKQVDILAGGMLQRWARPDELAGVRLPTWAADGRGDARRGARVFADACARCHGADGTGGSAGSVVDPWLLDLVSDQALRTNVIAGRPDLGQPDYRTVDPSGALADRQIGDLVAWLRSHRRTEQGP